MEATLVLNATFEPIGAVSIRRATVLVLLERAEIIQAQDGVFRSERMSVPIPRVIRLLRHIRIPFKSRELRVNRNNVLKCYEDKCAYCDNRATTIDHILPRSRGGEDVWENVVAACSPCNLKKGCRTPEEAGMSLRAHLKRSPRGVSALIIAIGVRDPSWEPYFQLAS